MKYIRTKDGKVIDISKYEKDTQGWYYHAFTKCYAFPESDIVKQADTIEELCDEFVIYDKDQNNGFPITCPKERLTEIKPYIQICMQKQFNCWLKGAIWTDKGLIYVAKMNEEGELELL